MLLLSYLHIFEVLILVKTSEKFRLYITSFQFASENTLETTERYCAETDNFWGSRKTFHLMGRDSSYVIIFESLASRTCLWGIFPRPTEIPKYARFYNLEYLKYSYMILYQHRARSLFEMLWFINKWNLKVELKG